MRQNGVADIATLLTDHLSAQPNTRFVSSQEDLLASGFALVSYLLPESVKKPLAEEIQMLVDERSARRDLTFKETSGSTRRMWTVSAADIRSRDGWVSSLYRSDAFRDALSRVAGESVLECPYEPEQYIVTHLAEAGDTHGWHWDDYSYGVIFVVQCPPVESGGFVQCVSGTTWNKDDPAVYRKLIDRPIRSYELQQGDLYILRTDTTLHRVHPITDSTRTIVNYAFAAERDLAKDITHETMENLFHQ